MSATLLRSAGLTGIVLLVVALAPLAGRVESVSAQTATVSAVTVASTSRTAATATATVSGAGTFSLRFSARGENAWGTSLTATATGAGDVTFALTGLAPNDYYDVDVSADSTFATGVVSSTFQNRPAQLDFATGTSNPARGIAGTAQTLWVTTEPDSGVAKFLAFKRQPTADIGERDSDKDILGATDSTDLSGFSHNDDPGGLWSDGTYLYAVEQYQGVRRKQGRVFVYSLADGARVTSKEFKLDWGHYDVKGIWADRDTFWIVNGAREAWAYKRTPSSQYGDRDSTRDIIVHPAGSYSVRGIWSDGKALWAIHGLDKVAYASDLQTGTALPALNIQMNDEHSSPLNTRGPAGVWGDGEYLWMTDSPSAGSKVLAYYVPKPSTLVSGLTVTSATSTTATITVRLSYPDASRTVYLRHKAPFAASWSANLSATGAQTVDFSVSGVSSLPRLVVQASLDSTFSNGAEITDLLLVRPAQEDFPLTYGTGNIRGIATNGTHMWVVQKNFITFDTDTWVRVYRMSDKRADSSRSFRFTHTFEPQGLHIIETVDEENKPVVEVWIVDEQGLLRVSNGVSGGFSFGGRHLRNVSIDINDGYLRGAWSDGTTLWTAGHVDEHVYAFDVSNGRTTGVRQPTREGPLATIYGQPRGMWSDGSTLWVVDGAGTRIYAYAMSSSGVGARKPLMEVNLARENANPWGLTSHGSTLLVADATERKIFAYHLPAATSGDITNVEFSDVGVSTATVKVTIANPGSSSQAVAIKYKITPDGAVREESTTTTGTSATFSLTGLSPGSLYALLVTLGATTELTTPGFQTRTKAEERAHFLRNTVVPEFETTYPWVRQQYDQMRRENVEVRAVDTGLNSVLMTCNRRRIADLVGCEITGLNITDSSATNKSVYVHELGHMYNAGARAAAGDNGGRGIAWLYFADLIDGGTNCRIHELYADAIRVATTQSTASTNYFTACSVTGSTPSAATLTMMRSVLANEIPSWFGDNYAFAAGATLPYDTSNLANYSKAYNLEQFWTDLSKIPTWKFAAVVALRDAFGGYCSNRRASFAASNSTYLRNPWNVGGDCKPSAPTVSLDASGGATWEVPPYDGGKVITNYVVQWKNYGQRYSSSRQAEVSATTRSYATGKTSAGSSVRVAGKSLFGRGRFREASQPPVAPGAPAVSAVNAGGGELTVQWSAPASSGGADITSYDVRSILSSASDKADANWNDVIGAWTSGDLEYTITSLTNGDSHDVEVRAVNSAGNGVWSTTGMVGTPASTDNTLSALSVGGARLSPTFTSAVTSYTASVGYTVTQITVTATENDTGATATLESPADADPDVDGYQVNLSVGRNDILIKVTAANGDTRTYTVTVTRTGQVTSLTPAATDPVAPFPSEADYTLTFQGAWTAAATPDGVPGGAHFSRLVGAVHNADVTFLASGGTASAGVESMAETGAIATLQSEVQTAINAATALSSFQGSTDTGGVTATQTLNPTLSTAHPQVTLVTMVAPTPDWFVGVSGLPLLNSSGRWLRSHTVNLYPWDAGTEDGTDFSLNNADTDPKVPIHSIRGTGKFSTEPIATLSFELQEVSTTRTVAENTSRNSNIGPPITAAATSGYVTYTLGGADAASFTIVTTSGQLRTQAALNYEIKDTYEVDVTATDANGSAVTRVTVDVTNVDEPPGITLASAAGSAVTVDGSDVTVDENHAGDLVDVTVTDPEGIHTDYTLALGGTHSTSFTLNTGVLNFTNPPDHEARVVYNRLTLTASNAMESSTLNVTVIVRDVNEPPTISGETEVSLNEVVNPTPGQVVRVDTYTKSDPDRRPSQTTNWGPLGSTTVLSGAHSDSFAFDQVTGRLTFASPPDYENGGGTYQVTLTANDGAAAGTLDVTVTVANVEETGTLTLGALQGVNGEALVATLTDPDVVATQTWVWQRRTGTSGAWTGIANTDASSYTPSADDVGNYLRASVTYTDGAGPNETTLTKATELPTLNDASTNQPPTPPDPLPQVAAVPEDAPAGRNVVQVVFTDPEGEQQLTYSLSGAAEFAIDSSTGRITVKSGELNYEETTSYSVTVSAADSFGAAGMVTLRIPISDVNEPPGITFSESSGVTANGNTLTVNENHDGRLATFGASDPENNQSLTYQWAVEGTDRSHFAITAAGELSFLNIPDYDRPAGGTNVYDITVSALDSAPTPLTGSINVTVTVEDVDEPADITFTEGSGVTANGNALTVDENHDGTLATFRADDPESTPGLTYQWSLDMTDHFAINAAGVLSFVGIPDFENPAGGTNVYDITVSALDSDGETGSIAVTVTVEDVDEPADITFTEGSGVTANGNALTVDENHDGTLATFRADDPESTPGLTYQWAVEGTDRSHFAITAAGELSFLNIPDYDRPAGGKNFYNITVQATDSAPTPLTGRIALTVTVEGVDEPPTITGDAARSIEEGGATLVGTYGATDPESATIAWQRLAGSDADEFEFTSSNGRLAFVAAPDFEDPDRGGDNVYSVTLGVSAGSHTITFDVVVTVTNKEEQGTLLLSSPQPQVEAAFTATLTDPDIVGATTWKWERSMSSGGGWQPIDGATAASYTPVVGDINYYLHATATYTDGYSANKSLSAVSANRVEAKPFVNTAPEFPPGPTTRSVPEDARANDIVGAPVVAADAEHAGQLTYTLTGGSDLFTIDGGSGQIRVAADESLDHETALSHSVMVTATDPSLALDTVTVTIDVTNVNEPPKAVGDRAFTDEDTAVIIRVLDTDSDPEDAERVAADGGHPAEQRKRDGE